MKTQINKIDGRFHKLTLELDIIEVEEHMGYMFQILEKHINIDEAPHNFNLFYTNLFKECQEIVK